MKKVSKLLGLSFLLFSVSSQAALTDLANNAGFVGCDSAIKAEFKS